MTTESTPLAHAVTLDPPRGSPEDLPEPLPEDHPEDLLDNRVQGRPLGVRLDESGDDPGDDPLDDLFDGSPDEALNAPPEPPKDPAVIAAEARLATADALVLAFHAVDSDGHLAGPQTRVAAAQAAMAAATAHSQDRREALNEKRRLNIAAWLQRPDGRNLSGWLPKADLLVQAIDAREVAVIAAWRADAAIVIRAADRQQFESGVYIAPVWRFLRWPAWRQHNEAGRAAASARRVELLGFDPLEEPDRLPRTWTSTPNPRGRIDRCLRDAFTNFPSENELPELDLPAVRDPREEPAPQVRTVLAHFVAVDAERAWAGVRPAGP